MYVAAFHKDPGRIPIWNRNTNFDNILKVIVYFVSIMVFSQLGPTLG